MRTDIKK